MNKLYALSATVLLCGCVANGIPNLSINQTDEVVADNTEKLFVGIPVLLSLDGSAARLNGDWLVTNAHNKPIIDMQNLEAYYHPTCDIALIRESGDDLVDVGLVHKGETVKHVGYPIGMPISINYGKYYGDITISEFTYNDCTYSVSDGVIASGMSGGGVYNHNNELVGINVGVILKFSTTHPDYASLTSKNVAQFLPLATVDKWLTEVTGVDFYPDF